jgi:hypothetical protein
MVLRKRTKALFRMELAKIVSFILIAALLAPCFAPAGSGRALAAEVSSKATEDASTQADVPFTDVTDSYASKEIAYLAGAGILSGYEDGTFAPRKPMSRAELAKVLALSLKLKEAPEAADPFLDVPKDSWYKGYVGALVQAGIAQGISDTAFSPDAPVTREQMVVLFVRSLGLSGIAAKLDAGNIFTDMKSVSSWAKHEVYLAYQIGLVAGIDNGDGTLRFEPAANAERQALAKLSYEVVIRRTELINKAKAFDAPPAAPTPEQKPEETPKTSFGGGGGGGGGIAGGGAVSTSDPVQSALSKTGTYKGDLLIAKSGSYGPSSGTIAVDGTLTIDPGPTGAVTLTNVGSLINTAP